jgi:hypothetical protein
MADEGLRHEHELDNELGSANMFAWFRPAYRLAVKHWPISLAVGFAALTAERMPIVPAMPYIVFTFASWIQATINFFIETLLLSVVIVVAYRFLAEKESVGAVNDWRLTLIRTVQITAIWSIGVGVLLGAFVLFTRWQLATYVETISDMDDVGDFVSLVWSGRVAGFINLIITILLIPVVMNVAVAGVLSTVYAVRSRVAALDAVRASFRLAFDQTWRIFWPTYLLTIPALLLQWLLEWVTTAAPFTIAIWLSAAGTFAVIAFGVALTFVIERAYAAHLTLPGGDEAAPVPSKPRPPVRRTRPGAWAERKHAAAAPTRAAAPGASAAPATPGAPLATDPLAVAAQLVEDLRMNRTQQLVETVERNLAADANFFASQPDNTLSLAKRLVTLTRPDLALRVMQPYLKDQRGHRWHLTGALFVAELMARDRRRLADAARFLAQVKTLYPREPMVDQLIMSTNKALAESTR